MSIESTITNSFIGYLISMLMLIATIVIGGFMVIFAWGFGVKIYSNIRQVLLEKEKEAEVQETKTP